MSKEKETQSKVVSKPYEKSLLKSLERFVTAGDELAKFAAANVLDKAHVAYSQDVVADVARDLKRRLAHEHNEIVLKLPKIEVEVEVEVTPEKPASATTSTQASTGMTPDDKKPLSSGFGASSNNGPVGRN